MAKTVVFKEKTSIIFILACLFGLIIRIYPDGQSLWLDELGSVTMAYKWSSLHEMFWNAMVFEINPPLYEIILRCWISLFGDSDYIVRLPNMIFGVLLIVITYFYGSKLFNKKETMVLTALMAVSWGGIYYSHEARSYSLLLLLSAILMLQSLKLILMNRPMNFRDLLKFLAVGFLLCHTQYFGALLYFSNLISLMFFVRSRQKLIILGLSSMAIFAPWLIINISHMTTDKSSWYGSIPLMHSMGGFLNLVMANKYAFFLLAIFILYRAVFQLKPLLSVTRNRILYYSAAVISLVLFFAVLIQFSYKPLITHRNLIELLPYSYMIILIIFRDSPENEQSKKSMLFRVPPVYLSACLVLVMMGSSFFNFITYKKQDWRGAADSIKRIQNIDKIYCVGNVDKYWHYLRKSDLKKEVLINIKYDGAKNISRPGKGFVSVLWDSHYVFKYRGLKKELTENNFDIIKEKYVSGSFDAPGSFCAYIVFK